MMEHFCTVFDNRFLPMGLVLAESLREHDPQSVLWIICVGDLVLKQLTKLDLPAVHCIPVEAMETQRLRAVKAGRSRGEYCWTLTPFLFDAVFERAPQATRVTYLDSDLCFFDTPAILLEELDRAGKPILITDHAFAPEYAHGVKHGRFCVQFLTFCRDDGASRVRQQWQEACLDWCYDRYEEGKFGDQKYLDVWPREHGSLVHVVEQTDRTLGPWNVSQVADTSTSLRPVFYHCHGLRIVSPDRARLYLGYRINPQARAIYDVYLNRLDRCLNLMHGAGLDTPTTSPAPRLSLRSLWYLIRRRVAYAPIELRRTDK